MNSTAVNTAAPQSHWRADATLAVVALVWGTTFVIVKGALHDISTLYFLALRFLLASVCMAPLLLTAYRAEGFQRMLQGIGGGFVTGICLALGYVLQTFGLRYTTAGNSGFLTGLYIVLVPLLSAAVYRRWPRLAELGGIAIAGGGMMLLTFPSFRQTLTLNSGDLLTIACAVAFAAHLLVLGYYSKRYRFEAVAFGQIACVAVLCSLALFVEPPDALWTPGVIAAIVVTGVFATALAFFLQTWAQQYTSATRAALIFALEPVFALATAVLAGGENLTVSAVLGGVAILAGILLVELKSQPAGRLKSV